MKEDDYINTTDLGKINPMKNQNMIIDLIGLDCDIVYKYDKGSIGGHYADTGEVESILPQIEIESVICKGINIITLLDSDQLRDIEDKLIENH